MIAQAQPTNHQEIAQRGSDMWAKIASLQMPSQSQYVSYLEGMHLAAAMILFICGLVYLLQGWKTFKMLVIVNAALLGGFVGNHLGSMLQGQNLPLFAAGAGALLCAVLAWPLMKFAVGLMAGLAGAFLGSAMWSYVASAVGRPGIGEYSWAGALMGLVTLGLLAFVVFRVVIMIFTSLQGSLMTVSGLVAMLMHLPPLRANLHSGLSDNSHLIVLLIGVPAIIGLTFQYSALAKKLAKKQKASESS